MLEDPEVAVLLTPIHPSIHPPILPSSYSSTHTAASTMPAYRPACRGRGARLSSRRRRKSRKGPRSSGHRGSGSGWEQSSVRYNCIPNTLLASSIPNPGTYHSFIQHLVVVLGPVFIVLYGECRVNAPFYPSTPRPPTQHPQPTTPEELCLKRVRSLAPSATRPPGPSGESGPDGYDNNRAAGTGRLALKHPHQA